MLAMSEGLTAEKKKKKHDGECELGGDRKIRQCGTFGDLQEETDRRRAARKMISSFFFARQKKKEKKPQTSLDLWLRQICLCERVFVSAAP